MFQKIIIFSISDKNYLLLANEMCTRSKKKVHKLSGMKKYIISGQPGPSPDKHKIHHISPAW